MRKFKNVRYYDVKEDLAKYPDAWCYLAWSKRGPGKTYSTLRLMVENGTKFLFLKRTSKDVELLCKGVAEGNADTDLDLSPFKPLNRDFGWSIYPKLIMDGFAAFYEMVTDSDGMHPVKLIGYAMSLAKGTAFKGFDMSEIDYLIFDEFIQKPWERLINRQEGEALVDLYMTLTRDRIKRGRPELKMICIANATNVSNPTFTVLDVVNIAADMDVTNTEYYYDEYRGIMMHFINYSDDLVDEEGNVYKMGIERAMEGTAWAEMAFGGHFAYNDFTGIGKVKLKHHKVLYSFIHQKHEYFVYRKEKEYFVCRIRGKTDTTFDLSREVEQKNFYLRKAKDLRMHAIEGNVIFCDYVSYDLIMNYKKIYVV